jgi:nitronate monooxygenase
MQTAFTRLIGIEVPIINGPFGSPELAAAVSNAGGLGQLSITWQSLEGIAAGVREIRQRTNKPFVVNMVLLETQSEQEVRAKLATALECGANAVSFHWDNPSKYLQQIHDAGAKVLATVGTAEEARAYAAAGADAIIAQGWEAGGHAKSEIALSVLVPRVFDSVRVPVIAAGGIADGRGLVAALALGASGVVMGTRFVASLETNHHPEYQQHLIVSSENNTYRTELFDQGWANAPHRVIRNSTVKDWERAGKPEGSDRPNHGEILARDANQQPVVRYSEDTPKHGWTGNLEAAALYAGQSVGLVHDVLPADEIVRKIMLEASAAIQNLKIQNITIQNMQQSQQV